MARSSAVAPTTSSCAARGLLATRTPLPVSRSIRWAIIRAWCAHLAILTGSRVNCGPWTTRAWLNWTGSKAWTRDSTNGSMSCSRPIPLPVRHKPTFISASSMASPPSVPPGRSGRLLERRTRNAFDGDKLGAEQLFEQVARRHRDALHQIFHWRQLAPLFRRLLHVHQRRCDISHFTFLREKSRLLFRGRARGCIRDHLFAATRSRR